MGDICMSQKERRRLELLARVRDEELSLVEVAELLPLSYRQCKRIWRRYQDEGDAGLVHRLRGRPSPRRLADTKRRAILDLYQQHYTGFGPTLAAEKLASNPIRGWPNATTSIWIMRPCAAGSSPTGTGSATANAVVIGNGASASRTPANWCRSTAVSTIGSRDAARARC